MQPLTELSRRKSRHNRVLSSAQTLKIEVLYYLLRLLISRDADEETEIFISILFTCYPYILFLTVSRSWVYRSGSPVVKYSIQKLRRKW